MVFSSAKYYSLFLAFLALIISGCIAKTPEALYYTLNASEDATIIKTTSLAPALAIGIGPVKFPSELDRPSIVTRSGKSRLVIDEFHRWGGSLEKNFLRVLADNLSHLLETNQVMIRPWEHYFKPDVRIALDIHQFDGRLGESASLKVTWMIYKTGEEKSIVVHQSTLKEPIAKDGYDALVAAQNRLLASLSKEIANVLMMW